MARWALLGPGPDELDVVLWRAEQDEIIRRARLGAFAGETWPGDPHGRADEAWLKYDRQKQR